MENLALLAQATSSNVAQWSVLLPTGTVFHLAQDSGVSLPLKRPHQGLADLSQKHWREPNSAAGLVKLGVTADHLSQAGFPQRGVGAHDLLPFWSGVGAPFNTPGTDPESQNLPVPFSWRQGRSLTDEVFIISRLFICGMRVCTSAHARRCIWGPGSCRNPHKCCS